jgi:uncharacterized RDD family membrane protein YckC
MPDPLPTPPGGFDSQSETMAPASSTRRDAPTRSGPTPGTTLGRYHLRRVLGKGGMGEVFEAEDLDSGRHVALKILARGLADERDLARFLREGRLAASISHPNTVYVFGTEEVDGLPIITMELASGGTLRDRVAASGPMAPSDAVDAVLQICAGLQAAEAGGVLHRDIKPSNCFIDAGGTVKVGDFGLSVSMLTRDETRLDATRAGAVIGTPAFASPEQLRGGPLDVRADIYSVSATLYYLVTGRAPFEDANLMQLLTSVAQSPPPTPRGLNTVIPAGLERVVLRGLAKKPQDRFSGYREFVAALEPFRSGAVSPATLGRRVLASVVDRFVLYAASSAAGLMAFAWLGLDNLLYLAASWWVVGTLVLSFVYFSISEGWFGASPGKALCGLRVVDAAGHQAPRARVIARSLVFAAATNVTPSIRFTVMDVEVTGTAVMDPVSQLIESAAPLVLFLILFCRARARNGYAGLHELATGTRVVAAAAAREWRPHAPRPAQPAVDAGGATRVGPYVVVGELAPRLRLGYDDRLQRHVWIRSPAPDESPVDGVRRDLARPARLRWLAGRRAAAETWDAFEAPAGEPLLETARSGRPWRVVRGWIHDLAAELAAGLGDGSLPDLALDRVWITQDGQARLLDWPAPSIRPGESSPRAAIAPDLDSAQRFVADVADFALQGRASGGDGEGRDSRLADRAPRGDRRTAPHITLPLGARATLDRLGQGGFDSAEAMALAGGHLAEGPAEVTRRRRALQLAVVAAPVVVTVVLLLILARAVTAAAAQASWMDLLDTAELLDALEARQAGAGATPAGAEELRAMRIYASQRLTVLESGDGIPAFARGLLASDEAESLRRARELVPTPTEAEIASAAPIAERLLQARRDERALDPQSMARTSALFALVFLVVVGGAGTVFALVLREGPLFRLLDIAIVTPAGARASRWRAAARALAAWMPVFTIAIALSASDMLGPTLAWTIAAAAATVFVAGAAFALFRPSRGLQDQIAGTLLVPRH